MREAFTYMFKDNCYYKKAFIYLILNFIANAFLAYAQINSCSGGCPLSSRVDVLPNTYINNIVFNLLGAVANLFVLGYFFSAIDAITKQTNNIVLPLFNIKNCFLKGLKFYIAIFLITLLLVLLSIPLGFVNNIISSVIMLGVMLFYLVFASSFFWSFANNSKLLTFFNIREAFKNVIKTPATYFKNILFILLVTIISIILAYCFELLFGFFIKSPFITMIFSTLISATLSAYFGFVNMFLIAKSIKLETV